MAGSGGNGQQSPLSRPDCQRVKHSAVTYVVNWAQVATKWPRRMLAAFRGRNRPNW
jgi:hypothetical protein